MQRIDTEEQLRRLIREEIRGKTLEEGFIDSLKGPFRKLTEKVKTWILEKSSEMVQKASSAADDLHAPDDMKKFLKGIEGQEGGATMRELISMVPGLSDSEDMLDSLKGIDFSGEASATTVESSDFESLKMSHILSEERYLQHQEGSISRVNESVLGTAVVSWYTFAKTVIGSLKLVAFLLGGGEKICKLMGMKNLSERLKKLERLFDSAEGWFISRVAFPVPVQYAAYLSLMGLKRRASKAENILSFAEFQSPDNKALRDKTVKTLKIALLCVIVSEALFHVVQALSGFFQSVYKTASEAMHAGETAGIEGKNVARVGAEIFKTRRELSSIPTSVAAASGAKSQV
jgi:hypothetical protein